MANYNLTNQTISSSFEQLVQHDNSTNILYDGTGSAIHNLEVTASLATTASYAENVVDPTWDNITNKPSGLVSGSSQIILQDTTGDLSGSRINGQVASALSASHAEFADSALSASHAEHSDTTQEVIINVKNTSGGPLSIGTPLYATGVTGDNINVSAADYNSSSTMPAIAVLQQALSNNQTGEATVTGKLIGVDTSGFTAGRNIYVTNGSFTDTRPTGSGVLVQNIGVVGKVNASEGEIVVQGSGRTNDLPNILEGYVWVGDEDGVAQTVATSSFAGIAPEGSATTGSNTFRGDQTISGSVIIKDTNAPTPGTTFTVINGSSSPALQIDNSGLSALTGATITTSGSMVMNGGNLLITDGNQRIVGNSTVSGSVDIKDTSGSPAVTLNIDNGATSSAVQVQNSALAGVTGATTILNGNTLINDNLYTNNITARPGGLGGGSLEIDLASGNLYTNPNGTVNVGGGLFVTQSSISSTGAIVFSYPFTGSGGSTGQVVQKFSDYGGGTQFDQSITGINFSYFKATDGGLIFETINSGEIKFFAASNEQHESPGYHSFKQTGATPAQGFKINDGAGDVFIVNNSALNGAIGTSMQLSGSVLHTGNSTQNGAGLISGSLIVKDASGAGPQNIFDVNNATNTAIGVSNTALAGITGIEIVLNSQTGNTRFDGGSSSKVESLIPLIVSSSNGTTTVVDSQATPGTTFAVNDGSANVIQVDNAALSTITGTKLTVSGNSTFSGNQTVTGKETIQDQLIVSGSSGAALTVQDDQATPGNVFKINDGSGVIVNVDNNALSTLTGTAITITKKTDINAVLKLGAQDPLPTGAVGELAVSGSNLYFHNGTSWGQIN